MDDSALFLAVIAALATAFCWALAGMIIFPVTRILGSFKITVLRTSMGSLALILICLVVADWRALTAEQILPLALSGFLGVVLSDTARVEAMRRLGPRRGAVIHASNAPLTVLLGWVLLGEHLPLWTLVGCVTVTIGVMVAVIAKRNGQESDWESIRGGLWTGLAFGAFAALVHAGSILAARPAMATGVDPIAASALRLGIGAICINVLFHMRGGRIPELIRSSRVHLPRVAISCAFGAVFGMTLLLVALSFGPAGIVATLSASVPILMLPLVWIVARRSPPLGGWVGAVLAVAGCGLIFLN